VRLREFALDRGLSLSEHGFKRPDGSEILCASEEQVYSALGLSWIPPELREDRGELEAARAGRLPSLVEESDLRGELHSHSHWSDGAVDLRALADAAREMGLEYLVITDHSKSLGMVQGLDEARVREQRAEVKSLQKSLGPDLRILHGAEVEILADGQLDFPDSVLAGLDLVIASVHTSLRQPRAQMTERVVRALANPNVDVLGHPTGRLMGKRDPSDLDLDAVFRAAAEHQVALEMNCHPERLDLNDIQARAALDFGCMLAIDTDAHHPDHLRLREYGVGMARRAWAGKRSVVNTWPLAELEAWLGRRKGEVRRDRG
jgi:DNA polymerase (family 10)